MAFPSLVRMMAHTDLGSRWAPEFAIVTPDRPVLHCTPLGDFDYHQLLARLSWGCRSVEVAPGVSALVARIEKALFGLVYLRPHGCDTAFLSA